MDHERRMEIAGNVANILRRRYGPSLLYVSVYGSTAKGTDRPDSDIDMLAITEKDNMWRDYHLKDVTLWITVKSMDRFNEQLYKVDYNWPYEVGQMMYAKVLYERDGFTREMVDRVSKLDKRLFMEPAEQHMHEAEEIMRKLVHSSQEKDIAAVRYWIPLFIEHTNMLIALLNRGWFTYSGVNNIMNVQDFREAPHGYVDLVRSLLVINDPQEVANISRDIYGACRKFAERSGIRIKRYSNEEELDI